MIYALLIQPHLSLALAYYIFSIFISVIWIFVEVRYYCRLEAFSRSRVIQSGLPSRS